MPVIKRILIDEVTISTTQLLSIRVVQVVTSKALIRGRTDHFSNIFTSVTLNFDLWPWPTMST